MMLYHYTTLSNLAQILLNHHIRLIPLNDLDDVSESKTKDMGIFGNYIFVNCWTDLYKENIPLWKAYTPDMSGVRIGLPAPYLKTYSEQSIFQEPGLKYGGGVSYLPLDKRHGKNYLVLATDLIKIEYTDDDTKLNPIIHTTTEGNIENYALGEMGKYKKTYWSFQSEWRFRIIIIPSTSPPPKVEDYKKKDVYIPMIQAAKQIALKKELTIKEFFLEIDETSYSNMEIMLGPKHRSGDLEIVNSLLNTHNPAAKFSVSDLTGDIR